MSIEQQIADLTAAVNDLTAAIKAGAGSTVITHSIQNASTDTGASETAKTESKSEEKAPVRDLKAAKTEAKKLGIPRDEWINLRKVENVDALIAEFKAKQESGGSDDDDVDLLGDDKAGDDDLGLDLDGEEEEEEPTYTLAEVKAKLGEVMNRIDSEAVRKIFQKVGVANAKEMKEEHFAKTMKLAEEALA